MESSIFIGLIFFLAGSLQGMTGFGSALVAVPLLCLLVDAQTAVPLATLNSLVITAYLLTRLKNHVAIIKVLPLCLSALPGALLGVALLHRIDGHLFKILLGLLLLAYGIYNLVCSPAPRRRHPAWAWLAGFMSGAIGSAFSVGGPPAILYATLNDWGKDEIKATLTAFFAFNSTIAALVHWSNGLTTATVIAGFAVSAPMVLLGTMIGSYWYQRTAQLRYMRVTFAVLIVIGFTMVVTA